MIEGAELKTAGSLLNKLMQAQLKSLKDKKLKVAAIAKTKI